jgi:hypothetical protein
MDPYAELSDQDEDLLLHDIAGLDLLAAAADRPDCPKQAYCCSILEYYALHLVLGTDAEEHEALHAAAARAAEAAQPITRRWAAYVDRLFGYRTAHGPVNRTRAEQMAADLLSGPSEQERQAHRGRPDWLIVQVTSNGRHWQCTRPDTYPTYLYINRRSGAWRRVVRQPLPADELALL